MVQYDLGLSLPATASVDTATQRDLAVRAEDAGFEYVFAPETWGRDAVTRLAAIATDTDDVTLGTGIIPVHSRSPALIAQTIATLDELSDGRAALGVGLSSPAVIERWHGVAFEPALRRQRETIEIVRQVLSGSPVEYDGHVFSLEQFRLRFEPRRADVPIFVAAQGPTNVELAGGFADGWMPNRIPRSALPELRTHLARGAELRDRSADGIETMPYVATCVLADGAKARARVRELIAFYVGAMGDFHFRAVAEHGFRDAADAIRDRWQAGEHDAARQAVPEALIDEIAIAGSPEEVDDVLRAYDDVADVLVALPPTTATPTEVGATIDNLGRLVTDA